MLCCGNNSPKKRGMMSHNFVIFVFLQNGFFVHNFYLPLNQKANDQLPAENELTWRGRGDTELRQNKQ